MSMSSRLESVIAASKASQEDLRNGTPSHIPSNNFQPQRLSETADRHYTHSLAPDQDILDHLQPGSDNYFSTSGATNSISVEPIPSPDSEQDWGSWIGLDDGNDLSSAACFSNECHPLFDLVPSLGLAHTEPDVPLTLPGDPVPDTISPGEMFAGGSPELLISAAGSDSSGMSARGKVRSHDFDDQDEEHVDSITKNLTSRLGRLQIAEDGQPRYYGATSNLHLLHRGPSSLCRPNLRTVVTHGEAAIARAGLQWKGDAEYEETLVNLFFSWHNALMYVVDKPIFFKERQQFRSGHYTNLYSPALENAIYTIGAAYTDRVHPDVDGPTDEFFGFRTKALLDIEIDSPTIATAQALLVLSSHEAAHARDSRGWIYSGMAVQILSDLGLHLNLAQDFSKFHNTNSSAAEVALLRQNLFWSANTIDTLWGAYSGRPSLMKRLAHNIPGPMPSANYAWEYYTDEYSTMNFPKDFDFHAAAHVHAHLAKLMAVFARVSEVLYSGVPDVQEDIEKFVAKSDADLQDWLSSLPPALRVDYSSSKSRTAIYLPAVLELHLIFNECVILLHRPLIAVDESSRLSISPTHRNAAQSFSKCVQAAQRVCQLLTMFRQRYGLRRPHHQMVHVTMTAGLIHVFQMCITSTGSAENQKAQQSFVTCIQSLGEMGQTYKSASRALDVITSLGQSWQQDDLAGRRVKWPKLQ
ncbi:hypothetical protein AYO20_07062 [Fonsecaea nubica]|uniref:Xylanolytic transcriptional activator regulatory domain-containing protein n=1 Tax=Fonsecaea nubica TaxID=856822 RepID=A0A178CWT3_9EURO|nr:hypothetical protein AYO20_07062 [Fonsecaea nubica]OAL33724.1 hypothetical protein AYO20_07062 [Fonsecaea nubica]